MFPLELWWLVYLPGCCVCPNPTQALCQRATRRSRAAMDGTGLASIAAGIDFHIPQFDAEAWLQLTILVVSLILCATASAAETAFTSIRRIKLKNLVDEGDKQAIEIENVLATLN